MWDVIKNTGLNSSVIRAITIEWNPAEQKILFPNEILFDERVLTTTIIALVTGVVFARIKIKALKQAKINPIDYIIFLYQL